MTLREFMRFHLLKVLLILVVIQIIIVAIIQNFNHKPVANRDQTSMIEGRNVKIIPLTNDLDKDEADELVLLHISKPIHGKTEQNANLIYYTPNKDFTGIDSFAYTISDGRKESEKTYVTIQVNKNLKPISVSDKSETYCKGSIIIDVLKNDNDREGDSIFIKDFSQPIYGKLKLIGNKLVYISNANSAQIDSFKYIISDGINNSDSATVLVESLSKTNPCYPWLSCDVGNAALPGTFTCKNKAFIIAASGDDIWNDNDGFRYAYQIVTGNCEMLSKVENLEGTNAWAKAGIMIRESLNGGSKCAFVCISKANGATYHNRTVDNESMEGGNNKSEIKTPYWIKLTRKGDTFHYLVSPEGLKWDTLGKMDVPMSKNVYIGLCVTSHNNNEMATGTFSNFKFTGKIENY